MLYVSIVLLLPGGVCYLQYNSGCHHLARDSVNQADSLGFHRCILSSTVQGESGTRCHPVVCDSIIFDRCVSKVFCLCFLIVFEMGYLSVIVLDISHVLLVYICVHNLFVLLECF